MARGTAISQGAAHEGGCAPEQAAPNVSVRLATEQDLPGLAELRWRWALEQHDRSELLPLEEFTVAAADWSQRHSDSHVPFVAVLRDETVGMAWLAILPRVLAPLNPNRASGDVQSCFVAPKLRGCGIGHRLVTEVVEYAHRRGLDYITVHSSEGAVRMYERAGFKQYSGLLGRSTV
ncbi:GNAT family N-acetyltransferase [Brevibacterium sp. 239c]|uniref:GNAT family N-acetyltransferase n=1 Tax=unclassified Brevibacterium TaxID=2614124 RepID=UPI000C4D8EDD|nr:Ribosomal protein S18 acetylase RimI [Brevibacterium sp. 239c]